MHVHLALKRVHRLLLCGIIAALASSVDCRPMTSMPRFRQWMGCTVFSGGRKNFMDRKALALRAGVQLVPENRSLTNATESSSSTPLRRVFLAVGSNLGDRHQNIASALDLLCGDGNKLLRTSFLHHTAPMYMTNQPAFLNGAIELETDLDPHSLLRRVKWVESELGRNFSEIPNGPRPVDLDLLFYDGIQISPDDDKRTFSPMTLSSPTLTIPHPLIQEREFVLAPLCEVAGDEYIHPVYKKSIGDLLQNLPQQSTTSSSSTDDDDDDDAAAAIRVLCLPRGRMIYFNETIIMGILNVTPDSFSDGGKWNTSIELAVQRALEMEQQGANIVDIGGESTRPGAKEVSVEEQIRRTVPVIQGIRNVSDIAISIDTRHAAVAKAAIEAGADIVNDVSGGTCDENMLNEVAKLRVPIILMHMRGTPESMQTLTEYDNVVEEVASALLARSQAAENAGIPRWLQVMDPGIGFAKDLQGNLELLKHMSKIRRTLGNLPILLGTSRKGFIGILTGMINAEERDYGTISSCVAALCLGGGPVGCNILRVHNVKAAKEAVAVMDAILNAK